jgi:hypothetical protein
LVHDFFHHIGPAHDHNGSYLFQIKRNSRQKQIKGRPMQPFPSAKESSNDWWPIRESSKKIKKINGDSGGCLRDHGVGRGFCLEVENN